MSRTNEGCEERIGSPDKRAHAITKLFLLARGGGERDRLLETSPVQKIIGVKLIKSTVFEALCLGIIYSPGISCIALFINKP